jgi:NADH-quinone oxidoreductase subunit L
MVLGIGCFAADSAIFHLFTHAFFKALLFLGAGSVMHAMGGIIDVRHFGGLRKVLPWTFGTFVIGSAALAGFPLLSGFFSKDEIIHHALAVHPVLGVIGLITALLTAFYTFRMVFLAFLGPERLPEGVHPHECGRWMLLPLVILGVGAVFAGYAGAEITGRGFHHFLAPVFTDTFAKNNPAHVVEHAGFWARYGLMIISGALAIAGILAAYVLYVQQTWLPGLIKASVPRSHRTLWHKYYVDEMYNAGVVEPARRTGRVCVGLDDYLIDGLVWLATAIPRGIGLMLRPLQSGLLQGYALSMVAGIAIIVVLVFWA